MKLTATPGTHRYDIIINDGTLAKIARLFNLNRRALIVTDGGVPPRYIKTIQKQCDESTVFTLHGGEVAKNTTCVAKLTDALWQAGIGRDDVVIALGGGLVCDVTGYAAARYLHGVEYITVPTTITAQAAASFSGTVSLNTAFGVDTVGIRCHPAMVFIDPQLIETLPKRQRAAGKAQLLATALAADGDLLNQLQTTNPLYPRLLYSAVRSNVGLMAHDTPPASHQLVRFGRTLGNWIEHLAIKDGVDLLYGECTALGLLPLIDSPSLRKRTIDLLCRYHLPTELPVAKSALFKALETAASHSYGRFTVARVKAAGSGYVESLSLEELILLCDAVY